MVVSLRANKTKILAVLVVIAVVVCGIIFIPRLVAAPQKLYGETPSQRGDFLKTYGWTISAEPLDARDVTIPKEFSEVYTKYNAMQKAQGFDLKPYSGKTCRQYIYLVQNYPVQGREIHATLLVYEGMIIGGDVSCAEVDGFMHGFAADSAHYGAAAQAEATAAPSASPSAETGAQPEQEEPEAQVLEQETAVLESPAKEPLTGETEAPVNARVFPTD